MGIKYPNKYFEGEFTEYENKYNLAYYELWLVLNHEVDFFDNLSIDEIKLCVKQVKEELGIKW